jgi:hypothetical protein
MNAAFRVVRAEENPHWPSGSCKHVAVITVSPDELSRRVGVPLTEGDEPGLGPWCAVALELASGAPVEIIRYDYDPEPGAFYVRADAQADTVSVRDETVAALGLAQSAIAWTLPDEGSESAKQQANER